ncbi:MAG TPA: signal peptide peptidase SppA [Verrucomicrobiae bacterium]|nr:signal peptide peptidase SppA [Verrucomicrobiae bacterium]
MDSNLPPSPPTPPPIPPPIPPPPPPQPLPYIPPRIVAPRRTGRGWKVAVLVLAILLGISLIWNAQHLFDGFMSDAFVPARRAGPVLEEAVVEYNHSLNKIAVVPVEGIISSEGIDGRNYSLVEYIRDQLELAQKDEAVKAVILKVNSPGGEVLASDDIYHAIEDFQRVTGKPVIAAMSSLAASGGYYVSAPCRWIVANELTITGSIGVIMSTYNVRGLLDKVGVRPQVFKSGKFKDMLSMTKRPEEISDEERTMVQKMVDETYGKFKEVVTDGRKAANDANEKRSEKGRKLSDSWTDFADGRVLSGKEAYEIGMVDELGGWQIAVRRARKLAKIENANLVQYHQRLDFSSLFRLFGKSGDGKVKLDLGLDIPQLKAGHLYFLSPALIH